MPVRFAFRRFRAIYVVAVGALSFIAGYQGATCEALGILPLSLLSR